MRCRWYHGLNLDPRLTLAIIDAQSIRSSDINKVPDLHIFQVLRHFATFWKFWVDILEVHLNEKKGKIKLEQVNLLRGNQARRYQ